MTKRELIEENKQLKEIIDFYFGTRDMSLNELIEKIKKQKKLNDRITKILLLVSVMFLCSAFYILGLSCWRKARKYGKINKEIRRK